MTLDEAIKHAEEVAKEQNKAAKEWHENQKWCENCAEEHRKLAEWLKELKQFKEQEPCVDCISRQAVIDIVRFEDKWLFDAQSNNTDTDIAFNGIISKVSSLPPVNPQPKTGHWIYICNSEVNGLKIVKCSSCGRRTYGSGKYCPNCGAKMVEPQENEGKE